MNYCTNCGHKVDSNAYVCIHCGIKLESNVSNQLSNTDDKGGIGWGILGFFVPMAGLVLYLVWKNEKPNSAKSAGVGALTYLVVYIAIMIIAFIFGFFGSMNEIENDYYYDDNYYNFE